MTEPEGIVQAIEDVLSAAGDLAGRRIVVTAGPTWEPIDPVRFVGNRSTGKMGFAVAAEAFERGAAVTLVVGPGTVEPPAGPAVVRVTTADEMRRAVLDAAADADAVVMAAAVADFRPETSADDKLKKEPGPAGGSARPHPRHPWRELGSSGGHRSWSGSRPRPGTSRRRGARSCGARACSSWWRTRWAGEGTGFGSDTNRAAILAADGEDVAMREWTKRELAAAICDRLAKLLTT